MNTRRFLDLLKAFFAAAIPLLGLGFCLRPSPTSATFPPNGLVAHWKFDEGSGTSAIDSSGNGYTGTLINDPQYVPLACLENPYGLHFDGANDYVDLPDSVSNVSSFTFAAWVYWEGGGRWQRIFDFGQSTSDYFMLSLTSWDDTMRFVIKDNGGAEQMIDAPMLPIRQWAHVAVTLQGNTGKIYINGIEQAVSNAITYQIANVIGSNTWLGRSQYIADPYFQGTLDDVFIYNRALSAEEIQTLAAPPDLRLSKQVTPSHAHYGELVTYTIAIQNCSGAAATKSIISDTLDNNLIFTGSVRLDPPQDQAVLATSPLSLPVIASNVTISRGEMITLTFPAVVVPLTSGDKVITNTAAITSAEVVTPIIGTAPLAIINNPALNVDKAADHQRVVIGQQLNYTYWVTNTGNIEVSNLILRDEMLQVTWYIPKLQPGEGAGGAHAYTVKLSDMPGPIVNRVIVTGTTPNGLITAASEVTVEIFYSNTLYLPLIIGTQESGN